MIRLALALVLARALWAPAAAQHITPETAADRPARERSATLPSLEQLSITRERPLFAPDRRPAAVAPTITETRPEVVQPRADFRLTGIIVEGSVTLVVLKDLNGDQSVVVRAGDKFGPWRVTVGSDRVVTLAGEGEDIVLRMFEEDAEASK